MDELTKVERLKEALNEYTAREIPDNLDPWPSMQGRLARLTSHKRDVKSTLSYIDMRTKPKVANASSSGTAIAKYRRLSLSLPMLLIVIVGAATLSLAYFTSIRFALPSQSGGSSFVPAGKVRHLVLTNEQDGVDPTSAIVTGTIEVWLANGPDNLLQRTRYQDYTPGNSTPKTTAEVWVQDNMMYTVRPDHKDVVWNPWSFASIYAPNPNHVSELLQSPGARIISDTVVDGRKIVVVDIPTSTSDHQEWIDKDTHRTFQWRDVAVNFGANSTITTNRIVVDELVDTATLSPDFFAFKLPEGYTLIQRVMPTSASTPNIPSAPQATVTP